jgi:hypothetical protein
MRSERKAGVEQRMNRRQRRANKAKILGRVFIDYGLDNVGRGYWRKRGRPVCLAS